MQSLSENLQQIVGYSVGRANRYGRQLRLRTFGLVAFIHKRLFAVILFSFAFKFFCITLKARERDQNSSIPYQFWQARRNIVSSVLKLMQ
jgi:hypothetical protein